ncbi:carbohydrate ABC transporter permease [Chloroflexia bacterium SDU3-3]|nr:carbohydrate ABC transporter permease [Chloroflexia bacterium SDU3-3]
MAATLTTLQRRGMRFPWPRFIALVVLGVLWAAPVVWMFLTSLKPEKQIIRMPPRWLPDNITDLTLENYRLVLFFPRGVDLMTSFMNSLMVALIGTILVVIVDVLAGYALARLKFRGRNLIFAMVVASMIVPGEIMLIPNYITVWRFGWLNQFTALVLPALAGGFGVFLLRQFMLGIPRELEEAAQLDGCNSFRILTSVILPTARGAVATLGIFTFLGFWNDFTWPYLVINEATKMTLPVALIQFKGDYFSNYGQLMAGAAVSALPAITVFLLAQRMIIQSITLTGIKG